MVNSKADKKQQQENDENVAAITETTSMKDEIEQNSGNTKETIDNNNYDKSSSNANGKNNRNSNRNNKTQNNEINESKNKNTILSSMRSNEKNANKRNNSNINNQNKKVAVNNNTTKSGKQPKQQQNTQRLAAKLTSKTTNKSKNKSNQMTQIKSACENNKNVANNTTKNNNNNNNKKKPNDISIKVSNAPVLKALNAGDILTAALTSTCAKCLKTNNVANTLNIDDESTNATINRNDAVTTYTMLEPVFFNSKQYRKSKSYVGTSRHHSIAAIANNAENSSGNNNNSYQQSKENSGNSNNNKNNNNNNNNQKARPYYRRSYSDRRNSFDRNFAERNKDFVPIVQPAKPVLSSSNIAAVIADTEKFIIIERYGRARITYPIMQVTQKFINEYRNELATKYILTGRLLTLFGKDCKSRF